MSSEAPPQGAGRAAAANPAPAALACSWASALPDASLLITRVPLGIIVLGLHLLGLNAVGITYRTSYTTNP